MRQIHILPAVTIVRENVKIAIRPEGMTGNGTVTAVIAVIAVTAGEGTTIDHPVARETAICLMTDLDGMAETETVSGSAIGENGEERPLRHGRGNPPLI